MFRMLMLCGLVLPGQALAGDVTPEPTAPTVSKPGFAAPGSASRVLVEAAGGSLVATGLTAGLGYGLAGWSNSLVPGLLPTALLGAFGPGVGAHYSLRLAADRHGWRMNHRGWAATAATGSSVALFGALVAGGASIEQPFGASAYLIGGSLLPIAAQWWAMEPRR